MATERIQIIVSSRGTVTVKKEIDDIGRASRTSSDGVNMLKGMVATLISGASIAKLVSYADNFTNLQNRLKLVTDGTDQLNAATSALFAMSQANRSSFEATTTLYTKVAGAAKAIGVSTAGALEFTDLFSKAATLSGSSAASAAQGVYQLTQALNKGKLDGDEFKSVMENLPYVAQVLTEQLQVTKGELYAMSEAGRITPQIMIEAFRKAGAAIRQDFAGTIPTISQALEVLNNSFVMFIGQISNSTGIFGTLAQAIMWVANNLDLVLIALVPLGAALTFLAVQTIGTLVISAMVGFSTAILGLATFIGSTLIPTIISLTVAMLSNPLFAAGAAAAIAGIVIFREQIQGLATDLKQALTDMVGLGEATGLIFKNGKIEIKGDDASAKILNAMLAGGDGAANKLKGAMASGAASIAKAGASAADQTAAAIAKYESLNGKVVKEMGNTLVDGGKLIANEVTGAVEKAAPPAADLLGEGVKAGAIEGGQAAGQTMNDQITLAGSTVGGKIAAVLQAAAFEIAATIKNQLRMQTAIMQGEAQKLAAEARKLDAESASIRAGQMQEKYGGGGGGGGGGGVSYSGGGGGSSTRGTHYGGGIRGGAGFGMNFESGGSGGTHSGGTAMSQKDLAMAQARQQNRFTIINKVDPADSLAAVETQAGKDSIINVIKSDPQAFRQALGEI